MLRLYLDHRVEQSWVAADVLSLDLHRWLDFAPFRVSHRLENADARGRFAWRQFTESSVWSMEIVPCGVRIKALLD